MIDINVFLESISNVNNNNDNRYKYYKYIIPKLFSKNKPIYIIETGSMFTLEQGSFTYVMAKFIKEYTGGKLITVDISKEHIDKCKELTKEYSDVIEYVLSDSVEYLKSLSDEDISKIDLFYFDSFDLVLPNPKPSQEHHLKELLSVYDRLTDDVILSVDDNYLPGTYITWIWYDVDKPDEIVLTGDKIIGKGTLINDFLLNKNWKRQKKIEEPYLNNIFIYSKVNQKDCLVITSYCDNEEKLDILRKNIGILKQYNKDICIHAHYPLPMDIQKDVNYYIYDKSNPIINFDKRSIIMWRNDDIYRLNILKRDYGFTVASQIKQSIVFLRNMGYDIAHVLNYDIIIEDFVIDNFKKIIDYSGIFYNKDESINLTTFSININKHLNEIKKISEDDYIYMNEFWFAEKYLEDKFKVKSKNNLYITNQDPRDHIRHQPSEFFQFDLVECSIHVGERIDWINNDKIYSGKYSTYLYNIKNNNNVDFKIFKNDELYLHENVNNNKMINTNITIDEIKTSFGYYESNNFIKGDNHIKFYINDKLLGENVTSKFCISAIEVNVP